MNPEDFDVIKTPIGEVETGSSLVINNGEGRPILFQVERKLMEYKPETGTVWTLESEPLANGEPLRIQGGPRTMVHRIVRKNRR